MKCEKCGKDINQVRINVFRYDGLDVDILENINECEEDAVVFETTQNWTGYELTEEEMIDGIRCPICGEFPFKHKEVQVYDIVRVVCFKEGVE